MRGFLSSPLLFVLVLALGVSVVGSAVTAQEPAPPATVLQPIAGGWSLLANTGEAAAPGALLEPIDDLVTAAFTFDALTDRFRAYRPGIPGASLTVVGAGEALWVFVPPSRLGGDVAFLEVAATQRGLPATLQPGFTLVGWTGADGVPISEAVAGLPVLRAYQWEAALQRFRIWDPSLPSVLNDDFVVEYGAGLWIDLEGAEAVVWEQG